MRAEKALGLTSLVTVLLIGCTTAQTIPPEEEDTCVSVNEAGNITYSCASEGAPILWRVASRQIRNPAELEDDGIFVTTLSANGSYSSTIVFNETGIDFLSELVGAMEFTVVCLVERDTFTIMEGDSRNVLIYSTPPRPENLTVTPTLLEWSRPGSVNECVRINYLVTITNLETNVSSVDGEGVSGDDRRDRQSFRYNADSELCQLHKFSVVSVNDAGEGLPATITETVPISPNVGDVSASLTAVPLLSDGIQIEVTFAPASSCDESAYPVVNYIISIPGLEGSVTETHTGDSIAVNLTSADINGLGEGSYTVYVMACAAFTCRSADPVHVETTNVKNASITFLNTTVSLVCSFAATASAVGCRFMLALPDGNSETVDLERPEGSVVVQKCATTQNMREAYLEFTVIALDSSGRPFTVDSSGQPFPIIPFVNVTEDAADISPCEPPTPEVMVEVVEESRFSPGEIAAIIIAVLVVFALLLIMMVIIVWWKRQNLQTAYRSFVHYLTEDEGIDLIMEGTKEAQPYKPTIMMLINDLVPRQNSSTLKKKKELTREVSHQPDLAVNREDEVALRSRADDAAPATPPTYSGKEPVACIKMKDPSEPNSLKLLLKPATLAHVVKMWKSKIHRGEEMLLYWKEDEEDVDDDEPYYEDPEDSL